MRQQKGSRNKTRDTNGSPAKAVPTSPGLGHNCLSDDDLQALFWQHKRAYVEALARKKDADAKFKNVCKTAKAELGDGSVEDIKTAIELETEEGEARISDRLKRVLRVSRWAGASIGTQFDMFDEGADKTPADDRAFAEGKRDGLKGEPRKTDYHPSTSQYRRYMDGYQVGQEALVRSKIKPTANDDATAAPTDSGSDGEAEPEGLPRSDWQRQMREQVADGDRHIKDTAERIGTERAAHTIQQ